MVGFNFKRLYDFLCDQSLENDREEITAQLKVSLWHEIAHGIIQYLEDNEVDVQFDEDEEDICEEYGKFKIKEYSGQTSSKLDKFLKTLKN